MLYHLLSDYKQWKIDEENAKSRQTKKQATQQDTKKVTLINIKTL